MKNVLKRLNIISCKKPLKHYFNSKLKIKYWYTLHCFKFNYLSYSLKNFLVLDSFQNSFLSRDWYWFKMYLSPLSWFWFSFFQRILTLPSPVKTKQFLLINSRSGFPIATIKIKIIHFSSIRLWELWENEDFNFFCESNFNEESYINKNLHWMNL